MEWGRKLDFLKGLQDDLGIEPPALKERPDPIWQDLFYVWDAFWDLSSSRNFGFGFVGAIPISEMKCYGEMFPIPDFQEFIYLIREMDKVYISWHNEQHKRNEPGQK